MAANEYYDSTGAPSTGSPGSSATMRAEFNKIEAGFSKMPQISGNNNNLVSVNSGGSGLESVSAAIAASRIGAELTANKDAEDGYAGLDGFKVRLKNTLGTVISFFANDNTGERTYTLPDKSGTVALVDDITGVNSGTNTGDQTASTVPNTPAGDILSTTVQGAINEIDSSITTINTNLSAVESSVGDVETNIDTVEAFVEQLCGRNILINSRFAINQRGVSETVVLAADEYGHDRWCGGDSGCTYTFETTNNTTTITILAGSLKQKIREQNVPNRDVVLSWSGTSQGRINGGSYGASGSVVASLTGGVQAEVEFSTGTLTNVQLEPGSIAHAYESISYDADKYNCNKYYNVIGHTSATADFVVPPLYNSTTNMARRLTIVHQEMVSTPTVTIINPSSTNTPAVIIRRTDLCLIGCTASNGVMPSAFGALILDAEIY